MKLVIFLLFFGIGVYAKVHTERIEYTHEGTLLQGVLAYDAERVAGGKKLPGVLIVHEWWGLNPFAIKKAEELAMLGYVAFALDMYGKGVLTDNPQEAGKLASHFRGKPLMRERANAGLEVLAKQAQTDPKRISAIGFCFGGTTVLELAYSGADLAGVVSFHGGLTALKPEEQKNLKAKILVLHGADDPFISAEELNNFQHSLRSAGADWQLFSYGGAVHSFTNEEADSFKIPGVAYHAKTAKRSWSQMRSFFNEIFE